MQQNHSILTSSAKQDGFQDFTRHPTSSRFSPCWRACETHTSTKINKNPGFPAQIRLAKHQSWNNSGEGRYLDIIEAVVVFGVGRQQARALVTRRDVLLDGFLALAADAARGQEGGSRHAQGRVLLQRLHAGLSAPQPYPHPHVDPRGWQIVLLTWATSPFPT